MPFNNTPISLTSNPLVKSVFAEQSETALIAPGTPKFITTVDGVYITTVDGVYITTTEN
jgi:hypothetical protein